MGAEVRARGWHYECHQTDHEGEFVQLIHRYRRRADVMLVNPGAWTHYSYAIHDALELVRAQVAEVHLSDVDAREEWRRVSVISGRGCATRLRRRTGRVSEGGAHLDGVEWSTVVTGDRVDRGRSAGRERESDVREE